MCQRIILEVTDLGKNYNIILRFPWLQKWNPMIDWKTGTIHPYGLEQPPVNIAGTLMPSDSFTHRLYAVEKDQGHSTTTLKDMKTFIPEKY